jgi:uncharacterized protein (DUF362 family)
MPAPRREFLKSALLAAAASQVRLHGAPLKTGLPGPYPGRVVAVHNPACLAAGQYQPDAIDTMMRRGMRELTGAPGWPDAWRALFEPGDVVGIKVSPVGGPKLCSDISVLHRIVDGLGQAGVKPTDIIVYSRYRQEIRETSIDEWLPAGVRWAGASEEYNDVQLDMDGYDRDHYMEMALIKPGEDPNDSHFRRSYVAKVIAQQVNKFINLPVLKHHQSAGVTICLKNMSHGMVNNVNRSHLTPTLNACGIFIPSVVNLPVIRQKAVLQICDGVKAQYHGGPGYRPQYVWEHKTMYFATDPVALDKTGLGVIDAQRAGVGMASIALSKPDKVSTFLNCQVEHIEIAGQLGLGVFDDKKIDIRRISL